MSRKALIATIAIVVLAGIGIGYYLVNFMGANAGNSSNGPAVAGAKVGFTLVSTDRTQGNPKAPITLIEYGAPTCSICAAFDMTEFPQLKKNYIDTGKVFYVFRVYPLRPDDGAAEKMARCLPEDKYFSFIDLLWRNQPKWDAAEYPGIADVHGALVQLGRIAGMSAEQVDQCISNKAEDDRINKVAAEAEQRYALSATPTFVVDGVLQQPGSIPYDELAKILDAAIAKKK